MKNSNIKIFNSAVRLFLFFAAAGFVASCELRPDLPESGSIPDETPPAASFESVRTAEDFRIISFTNTSVESTKYEWDFGADGVVCEEIDGEIVCSDVSTTTSENAYALFAAGEGTYTVSLTALDDNEASNTITVDIVIVDEFVPLPVTVLNGDFEDGNESWTISNWMFGTETLLNLAPMVPTTYMMEQIMGLKQEVQSGMPTDQWGL